MSAPLVSIIVPVFNQLSYTRNCLESIYSCTEKELFDLIVVDNHSTDGSLDWIIDFSKSHSNVRYISLPENRGFSPAVNAGAELSKSEFLLFLNNDTVVTNNWLDPLLQVGQQEGVGAVGAKLIYPETNTINHIGYAYSRGAGGFVPIYHHFNPDQDCVNYEREFQAILGACLLVRRDLFNQLGGFALYGLEDIDLCLKLRALNLKIIYTPKSTVYHHGSVTLRNSSSGSFPVTTVTEFNRVWPQSSLVADDHQQFAMDGFEATIKPDGSVGFKENISTSMSLVSDAKETYAKGDLQQALRLLQDSLRLFGRNREALIELIALLLEKNDFKSALPYASNLVKYYPDFELGVSLLREINAQLISQ